MRASNAAPRAGVFGVTANPEKVLHETTISNDVSFRKIILGGAPGHRTVKVPPWHGLDPEP